MRRFINNLRWWLIIRAREPEPPAHICQPTCAELMGVHCNLECWSP